ncbi:MAG: hypothetical protein Fur0041_08040 [Bacteroidia bacterium]
MFWHLLYVRLESGEQQNIIISDGAGYYAYLPAVFIYNDLQYSFTELNHPEHPNAPGANHEYFRNTLTDSQKVNKYFYGTSLAELPFFCGAVLYATFFDYPVDGYSLPFQIAVALAAIGYTLLGLFFLKKLLMRKGIQDGVAAIVLLMLFLGTNLYHYTLQEPSMSHAFSFGIIALFLYHVSVLLDNTSSPNLLKCVFLFGLIVMIRPVNAIVLAAVPLLADSLQHLKQTLLTVLKLRKGLLFAMLIFISMIFIQLIIWKAGTGHWWLDSYKGEHMNLMKAHVFNVLFSFRKGFFIYTPLMLLAIAGIFFMKRVHERITFAVFFLLNVWIISAWQLWHYGGSLGMRPMIDSYSVFAFPLAFFTQRIFAAKLKYLMIILFGLLTIHNLIQHYQYKTRILPYDGMTKEKYRAVFLKTNKIYADRFDPAQEKLHSLPNGATKISSFSRTFEEDTSAHFNTFFGVVANEQFVSGNHAVMINDTIKSSANLAVMMRDAFPETMMQQIWVVVKAKVYVTSGKSTARLALAFKDNAVVYNWQAPPLLWQVEKSNEWTTFTYVSPLPPPASAMGEVVTFIIHDDPTKVYADDFEISFWKAP